MASNEESIKRRRPHKKAKTGCSACRNRHIKCGEEKPKCRSCVRRKKQCQYPIPDSSSPLKVSHTSTHDDHASAAHPTPSSIGETTVPLRPTLSATNQWLPASELQDTPDDVFGLHEMALLHHWTISTSLEIFKVDDISVTWQIFFPQIAFRHLFVMHAILGLSALHLAFLNPTDKRRHMADAAHYHTKALQGFQQAVSQVVPENSEGLFVWTTVNLLYVFGISGRLSDNVDQPATGLSHKDRVFGMEWIPMIRGIEAVFFTSHNFMKSDVLKKLVDIGNWFELDPGADPDPQDVHFRRVSASWDGNSEAKTYDEALWILRKCRAFIAQFAMFDEQTLKNWGFNRAWSGPLMFIHFAPHAYFTLLEQRQPAALVLFAHFGVLMRTLDYCCFMDGWGRDIVATVDDSLGDYWRPWVEWPAHMVGLR